MREIKFRGKSVEELAGNSQWITDGYGVCNIDYVDGREDYYLISPDGNYRVFKDSIGQYTGLKDCNDVNIYEGDIIAIDGLIKGNRKVYWHDNFACWAVTNFGDTLHLFHDDCEVIGNIYENPELIKR